MFDISQSTFDIVRSIDIKFTSALFREVSKKINQICGEKPEIIQNREHVTLQEDNLFSIDDGGILKRYAFSLADEWIAFFYVNLDEGKDGSLQIKISDVTYPQN